MICYVTKRDLRGKAGRYRMISEKRRETLEERKDKNE